MNECVLCGHTGVDHRDDGCHGRSPFFGACSCGWVAQEPLAVDAGAVEYRARSDWWDLQARTSWDMALRSRDDLDRWDALMRFHRIARQAEIDHRHSAESLERTSLPDLPPVAEPVSIEVVPSPVPEPTMPFSRRLELASIA